MKHLGIAFVIAAAGFTTWFALDVFFANGKPLATFNVFIAMIWAAWVGQSFGKRHG